MGSTTSANHTVCTPVSTGGSAVLHRCWVNRRTAKNCCKKTCFQDFFFGNNNSADLFFFFWKFQLRGTVQVFCTFFKQRKKNIANVSKKIGLRVKTRKALVSGEELIKPNDPPAIINSPETEIHTGIHTAWKKHERWMGEGRRGHCRQGGGGRRGWGAIALLAAELHSRAIRKCA